MKKQSLFLNLHQWILTFSLIWLLQIPLSAQLGINTDGSAPDASAMLDVVSTDKGVLIPRLTQTQRDVISSPATGLLIFQSDNTAGFYFYTGSVWQLVGDGTGTDHQTATEVVNTPAGSIAATNVQAAINELDTEKLSAEVDGSTTNEIQTIDVSTLTGTTLNLSLSNDEEATKTVDLSSLKDGTGTDDQTAAEVANTAAGNIAATNVQAAINELDTEKLSTEVDGSTTNEIQTIDVSTLTGTTLNLSLINDGEATKTVDLSSLKDGTGTDDQTAAEVVNTAAGNIAATNVQAAINELDTEKLSTEVDGSTTNEIQTIDVSTLTGTTLNLSLINDGEATKTVDLSSLKDGTGTDDQTAAEVVNTAAGNIAATNVQAAINELDTEKLSTEVDGSTTNEIQTIDVSTLTGTTLNLSLINDGEATKTVDLSSLQDGTGTDDQTAAEVANTAAGNIAATNVQAAINELDTEKLSTEVDGSTTNEIQTIDVSTLTGTTLNLSLINDGEATKTVDLSSLKDGTGTDDQTASEVANTAAGNIAATNVQAAINELDTEKLSAETQDLEDVLGQDAAANGKITNLIDPTAAQDAATKKYVDDENEMDLDKSATNEIELPTSPTAGTMSYYEGSAWVSIAPDSDDQTLSFCSGVPTWGECPPVVGDFHEGGVVFYLFQNGDDGYVAGETHGLIAAPRNQSSGIVWGCHGTDIAALPNVTSGPSGDGHVIGYGTTNTAGIVATSCANPSAAKLCADLNLNGFDDWFLPSTKELNKMHQKRTIINSTASTNGGW